MIKMTQKEIDERTDERGLPTSTVGPFNCPKIGDYYVVRTPCASDPFIFTKEEYNSMTVPMTNMDGYVYESLFWRRIE